MKRWIKESIIAAILLLLSSALFLVPYNKKAKPRKANAVVFVLVRNEDLPRMVQTMRNFERRFNSRFNYPYLFLNDVDFNEEFKKTIKKETKAFVEFGTVPKEHWSVPAWIDVAKMEKKMGEMERNGAMFASKLSYHHMCRFNAGFFFRHKLIMKYDYYWRIEPDVQFHCTLPYDPFLYMQDKNKDYGFNIMLTEFESTIPTLWKETVGFIAKNPQHAPFNDKTMKLFKNKEGKYTLCHFWSNFEIANLNMWRSKAYMEYFEWLDKTGGFYYERWGDAPIHTLAVAFMLPKSRIHYFKEIGYTHSPYTNCSNDPVHQLFCDCNPEHTVKGNSCLQDFIGAREVDVY